MAKKVKRAYRRQKARQSSYAYPPAPTTLASTSTAPVSQIEAVSQRLDILRIGINGATDRVERILGNIQGSPVQSNTAGGASPAPGNIPSLCSVTCSLEEALSNLHRMLDQF